MDALFAHSLVVVTGKGGVGKSTVATALGIAASRRGLRTLVVEVAARDDVSRALGASGAVGAYAEQAISDRLHHISIDPQRAMEEYLRRELPAGALAALLSRSRIFTSLTAATPGMRELLTIGKVWELAQPERRTRGARPYDLVVLDAPATGYGLALLKAPDTFASVARVGPVARQGRAMASFLGDPRRTAVVAVSTAEEMPVTETLELRWATTRAAGTRPRAGRPQCRGSAALLRTRQTHVAGGATLAGTTRRPVLGHLGAPPACTDQEASPGPAGRGARHAARRVPVRARQGGTRATLAGAGAVSIGTRMDGKRICICTGSGGVGKTTTAAAVAMGLAARGQRVAVLTIDPARRLASSLGLRDLGNEPSRVDPSHFAGEGLELRGELWAMMLDAKRTFDELIEVLAPDTATYAGDPEQPHIPRALHRRGRLAGVQRRRQAL